MTSPKSRCLVPIFCVGSLELCSGWILNIAVPLFLSLFTIGVQMWPLVGPFKDIDTILHCLSCRLQVVVMSKVMCILKQAFLNNVSKLSSVYLSLDSASQALLLKTSPHHDPATTVLHCTRCNWPLDVGLYIKS